MLFRLKLPKKLSSCNKEGQKKLANKKVVMTSVAGWSTNHGRVSFSTKFTSVPRRSHPGNDVNDTSVRRWLVSLGMQGFSANENISQQM